MARYRARLPHLSDRLFLSDGGIETSLIYLDGFELPMFAAFDLFKSEEGRKGLRNYFVRYASIARAHGLGFVLEGPTWRANPDWAAKLGYPLEALARINRQAIALMIDIRNEFETAASPMVISGCLGPRGDGYDPGKKMTASEAEDYHAFQAQIFAGSEADLVTAITMNYVEEAIGVARAAAAAQIPSVISFTLETDGRLPTGQTLESAIGEVDEATDSAPAYYMINCAHPSSLRRRAERKCCVDGPHPRNSRQCIEAKPRGTRRCDGATPAIRATSPSVRDAAQKTTQAQRRRRVLRNRPSPYRADCFFLHHIAA